MGQDGDRDGDRKVGEMIYGSELEKVPAVQLQDVAFSCLQSIPQAVSLNAVYVLYYMLAKRKAYWLIRKIDLLLLPTSLWKNVTNLLTYYSIIKQNAHAQTQKNVKC